MGRVKWLHVPCLGVQVLHALFATWKAGVIWCGTDINVFLWTDHPLLMTRKIFWYYNYPALSKDAAQFVELWVRCCADERSIAWSGKWMFSPSQLSVQTLLQCSHSPCVRSHALTSVHKFIIPSTNSNIAWLHKDTAHTAPTFTDRMWLPKWLGNWKQSHTFLCLGKKWVYLKLFPFFYCLCGWGKEDCRRRRRRINLWHMHTSTWSFSETCMQLGVYLYTEQYLSLAWWKTLHDRLHILRNAQFNFE